MSEVTGCKMTFATSFHRHVQTSDLSDSSVSDPFDVGNDLRRQSLL